MHIRKLATQNNTRRRDQYTTEKTDDTVEDTTYKMPPSGHDDESESDDEVLVKRMKKIKQPTKSRPKKIQVRSKKRVKAQLEKKKEDVQKTPKPPIKSGQLLVFKHKKEQKSLKKDTSATVRVEEPKSMQSVPKPVEGDTKTKKIFQTRMSPSGFVAMIDNFNEVQRKTIRDMGLEDSSTYKSLNY